MDLVIRNAKVVSKEVTEVLDVGVRNGKVVKIGKIDGMASKEIDASGKFLLPGVIDVHTHIEQLSGDNLTCDDFSDATYAAAVGGTTSILTFVIQQKGKSPLESVSEKMVSAKEKMYIDYGFHIAFTDVNERTIAEIPELVNMGIKSIKVFMAFENSNLMVSDYYLIKLMEESRKYGALVGVHAENEDICVNATENLKEEGFTTLEYYYKSRPEIAELEATNRAITFAEDIDCPVYIFHLTSSKALSKIEEAQQRGVDVIAETCPHYLLLDKEEFESDDAYLKVMSPPLREKKDQDALWKAIKAGAIKIISTDHCPYTPEQKAVDKNDFTTIAPGIPGIQTLLPLIYSKGVASGKISINKMVEVLSYNPAQIFNLNNKGEVKVGYDADFVIFNPDTKQVIDKDYLKMKSGYSSFAGLELKGKVETTVLRGKIIYDQGKFVGQKGKGIYINRK